MSFIFNRGPVATLDPLKMNDLFKFLVLGNAKLEVLSRNRWMQAIFQKRIEC